MAGGDLYENGPAVLILAGIVFLVLAIASWQGYLPAAWVGSSGLDGTAGILAIIVGAGARLGFA